jgi:tRNA modification GTPase
MKNYIYDDTIAAISTPVGEGGIGIVRISGKESLRIADMIFLPRKGGRISDFKTFTVHYGDIIRANGDLKEVIDEVLVTVMRAPNSYTTEDIIEISCHGGLTSLRSILNLVIEKGARLAEPGEFTKRAFLNGRIDLAQAEAVLDMIRAKTETFLKVSANQLKGDLSSELQNIRSKIMDVYVQLEAIVNFPEEDISTSSRQIMAGELIGSEEEIQRLIDTGQEGRVLKEGIRVVIAGRPNVGKSSLLNVILKQERAIVSNIAGTTRDTIEETAQIKGIPFQVIDTAGILEPRDIIEEEAVKRSKMHIESADLVIFLMDASEEITPIDKLLFDQICGKNHLLVMNKADKAKEDVIRTVRDIVGEKPVLQISALTRNGISELENAIVESVTNRESLGAHGVMVSNLRHLEALNNAGTFVSEARQGLETMLPAELISENIKTALHYLDKITGRDIDQDLLDNIFAQFCIGK